MTTSPPSVAELEAQFPQSPARDAAHIVIERSRDRLGIVGRDSALASDCYSDEDR